MRCQFRATSVHSLLLVSYVNKLKSTISLLKLVSETREIIAEKGTNGRLIAFKRPLFIRNFVEENNPIDYKYNLSNRINNKKLIIIQRLRNSNRASYPSQTQNQIFSSVTTRSVGCSLREKRTTTPPPPWLVIESLAGQRGTWTILQPPLFDPPSFRTPAR